MFTTIALTLLLQATPATSTGPVRAIHIAGQAEALGPDRKIGACLIQKLQALGPFTFPDRPDQADAVLTFKSSIPSGAMRTMWGRSPEVKATLTTPAGAEFWKGSNKYKKSTTVWAAGSDIECGLANGLANKLVDAIQKGR